ncbi:MAG: hypothetical protein V7L11_06750 [Nostoc sp.]
MIYVGFGKASTQPTIFLQHFSLATPLRVRSLYNCDIYDGRSCGTLSGFAENPIRL